MPTLAGVPDMHVLIRAHSDNHHCDDMECCMVTYPSAACASIMAAIRLIRQVIQPILMLTAQPVCSQLLFNTGDILQHQFWQMDSNLQVMQVVCEARLKV